MDQQPFTSDAPGKLTPVTLAGKVGDWTFIPDDLPPRWEFPPQLWPLLTDAKEALGTLNGIGQTIAENFGFRLDAGRSFLREILP